MDSQVIDEGKVFFNGLLNNDIEEIIKVEHPEFQEMRGTVNFWNFLPPADLNNILSLYEKVTNKTLRISKVFGIEGKQLLTPDDDWDALREFNIAYEGTTTPIEQMHLDYSKIEKEHPDLIESVKKFPSKVFSGKDGLSDHSRSIFFCYNLPLRDDSGVWGMDIRGWLN